MSDLRLLKEETAKALADMQALNNRAIEEKRDLNAEEEAQYDSLFKVYESKKKLQQREQYLQEELRTRLTTATEMPHAGESGETRQAGPNLDEVRGELRSLCREGDSAEYRLLQKNTGPGGGYLMPQEVLAPLLQGVDDEVFIRAFATKFTVNGFHSLGVPTIETNPADADWTAEAQDYPEDTTLAFGKRELKPNKSAKLIKLTEEVVMNSAEIENIVAQRFAYKFGITEEKAFMTGNGSNKPLGVFTASDNGIPTSRDLSTDNTTTAVTANGLLNAKYSLKGQYFKAARWVGHRDFAKQVSKLTDGNGQYLLGQLLKDGVQDDTLIGRPLHISEYAPNTFTTAQYVAVLGDFKFYYIANSDQYSLKKLVELYAASGMIGMVARMYVDGMPALAEAFTRVKLG